MLYFLCELYYDARIHEHQIQLDSNKLPGMHTILNLTMAVLWHVTPNSFVCTCRFGGTNISTLNTTAVFLSETVEFIYETARRHITEGRCVEDCRLENLTHCGRVTQICVFNTVKLGTSASSP